MDQLLVLYDSSNIELELYSCLSFNVDAFSTFHNDKLKFLHRKEGEVCKRYGIALHLCVVPRLQEVDHHELKGLLEAFIELQKDLTKRQWYDRVNRVAIHRIYGKLEKCSKSISPSHHGHRSTRQTLPRVCTQKQDSRSKSPHLEDADSVVLRSYPYCTTRSTSHSYSLSSALANPSMCLIFPHNRCTRKERYPFWQWHDSLGKLQPSL